MVVVAFVQRMLAQRTRTPSAPVVQRQDAGPQQDADKPAAGVPTPAAADQKNLHRREQTRNRRIGGPIQWLETCALDQRGNPRICGLHHGTLSSS